MNTRSFIAATLIALCIPMTAAEAPKRFYQKGTSLYVYAIDGLNLREKPDASSDKIITIAYGEKVVVEALTQNTYRSSNIDGYWVQVNCRDKKGYLFDGFLCALPAPDRAGDGGTIEYAQRKLGKRGEPKAGKNGSTIQGYNYDVEISSEKSEISYELILTVKNIRMSEAFLLGRALAISQDWWFTEKDEFPAADRQYKETYKSTKGEISYDLLVETTVEKSAGALSAVNIRKDCDGYLRLLSLKQKGDSVVITFTVVD